MPGMNTPVPILLRPSTCWKGRPVISAPSEVAKEVETGAGLDVQQFYVWAPGQIFCQSDPQDHGRRHLLYLLALGAAWGGRQSVYALRVKKLTSCRDVYP